MYVFYPTHGNKKAFFYNIIQLYVALQNTRGHEEVLPLYKEKRGESQKRTLTSELMGCSTPAHQTLAVRSSKEVCRGVLEVVSFGFHRH
jgi:hypothetical protein